MARHLVPGLLATVLLAGTALAQQTQAPAQQQPPTAIPPATNQTPGLRAPAETRPGEPARAENPGGVPGTPSPSANEPVNIATAVHSDDLIGANVRNERNENIGTVEALLISPDGKVAGVVLDVGGFLGMGTRQVVVSMAQLSMVGKDVRLTEGTKASLRALPPYQRRTK